MFDSDSDVTEIILSPTRAKKVRPQIRSDTGFSSVKTAENRNFAWSEAWEKANIAINAGK